MISIIQRLHNRVLSGHSRTVKAKKNIIGSILIKGTNILISFVMVPIVLHYLNPTRYGIWLTIDSIVGWFAFFDIGLGQGLRNKFAQAIAKKDIIKARTYVSTTYIFLILIIVVVYLIYLIVDRYINWAIVFNSPIELNTELKTLFLIVFTFFCIQFIIQLILTILIADQRPAISDLISLISKIISSLIILILAKTTHGSLIYLGLTYGSIPVIILVIATFYFFSRDYKYYKPSIKYFDFKFGKDLMNLGGQFFIMQIAVVVMFSTDNMIITQIFSPAEVTPYNIAYKYFGIITMGFSIIVTPLWSATTEAYMKHEYDWIKKTVKDLRMIWLLCCIVIIIMLSISKYIFPIWIGTEVKIPFLLSLSMTLYVILLTYGSIYVSIINGIGKIRLQFYTAIASAVLNIPLSILLAKYLNLGTSGVILATAICILYGPLIAPIQYKKIITNNARGIWNK